MYNDSNQPAIARLMLKSTGLIEGKKPIRAFWPRISSGKALHQCHRPQSEYGAGDRNFNQGEVPITGFDLDKSVERSHADSWWIQAYINAVS